VARIKRFSLKETRRIKRHARGKRKTRVAEKTVGRGSPSSLSNHRGRIPSKKGLKKVDNVRGVEGSRGKESTETENQTAAKAVRVEKERDGRPSGVWTTKGKR